MSLVLNLQEVLQKCPFLRNINKPTTFSFASLNFHVPARGDKGPLFEDGPNFDLAFKLFHGKDGVVPHSGRSPIISRYNPEPYPEAQFNPLAAETATISLAALKPEGLVSPSPPSETRKKLESRQESSMKRLSSSEGNSSKHEALRNEWLETGNCPIAKSYRAVSHVLPLFSTALLPSSRTKLRCPPAVVAARAVLARSALVKNLLPQSLSAKMHGIGVLGIVKPLFGVLKEHAKMFLSWFAALPAAVSCRAMLGKFLVMPTTLLGGQTSSAHMGDVSDSDESPIQEMTTTEGLSSATQHILKELLQGPAGLNIPASHSAQNMPRMKGTQPSLDGKDGVPAPYSNENFKAAALNPKTKMSNKDIFAGGNAAAVGSVGGRGHSIDVGGKASNVSVSGRGHIIAIGGSGNTIVLSGRGHTFAGTGAADAGPSKRTSKGKGKMIAEIAGPSRQSSNRTGRIKGANAGPSKKCFKGKGRLIA